MLRLPGPTAKVAGTMISLSYYGLSYLNLAYKSQRMIDKIHDSSFASTYVDRASYRVVAPAAIQALI